MMMKNPDIINIQTLAASKLFQIEALDLAFSNGQRAQYERIVTPLKHAVIIVPMLTPETLLLTQEYQVGSEQYGLTFPKGKVDPGETPQQAAIREMREEIGYTGKTLQALGTVDSMPGYIQHQTHFYVAQQLTPAPLSSGDEPEPLPIISWPIAEIDALIEDPRFTDARNLAILLLVQKKYGGGPSTPHMHEDA